MYRLLFKASGTDGYLPGIRHKRDLSNYFDHYVPSKIKDFIQDPSKMRDVIKNKAQKAHGYITSGISNAVQAAKKLGFGNGFVAPFAETHTNGLIYKIIAQDPELLEDPEVLDVIRQVTGFGGKTGLNPYEVTDVLKVGV